MLYIQRARLVPGAEHDYDRRHRPENVRPGLAEDVRAAGFTRYVIARDGLDLFSAVEVEDAARAADVLARSSVASDWLVELAPLMQAEDYRRPWRQLRVVYDLDRSARA